MSSIKDIVSKFPNDIQTMLKQIKNAVYGEEVRDSIHDLISRCYYEGKAGGNDLEARDRAAAAEARIDAFTSLKTGSTTGDAELMDVRIGADGTKYKNAGTAVREQVRSLHSIEVSETEPTRDNTLVWINPKDRDTIEVPEVLDDVTNDVDTWSSNRISDRTSTVAIKWVEGSYVDKRGWIITDDSIRMMTELIPCHEGIDVTFIAETVHENISCITFYNAKKEIIQTNSALGENGTECTVTSPEGTRFLRLSSATTIGWMLRFSESPIFKYVEELAYNNHHFNTDVDFRIAYNHVINGVNQKIYSLNRLHATTDENGTITVAPGGYYFATFKYGSFGGNAYVGVKWNLDERLQVCFSENGTNAVNTVPYFNSVRINDYEVIRIDKLDEYDYPYAIVRIDNREGTEDIIVSEIKIVDGDMPLPDRPYYVSTYGSDENDGSVDSPFATVNQALISGASNIYIYPGVYRQTINLDYAHHCNVNISSYGLDGRVIFYDPKAVIAESAPTVDGYQYVRSVQTDRQFGSNNIWIFQDGLVDYQTVIADADRHPLQRGYEYRCEDTRIIKCKSDTLGDALEEIEGCADMLEYRWFLDASTQTLYFASRGPITEANPLCGSSATSLFLNTRRNITLNVSGIECKYLAFDISRTTNSVIKDCKATNVCKAGAFIYDQALSCEFIRCEAARCFSGSNGDGFNAHSHNTGDIHSKQTVVTLIDCWSHDNNDDGYSDHERSEITIIGGLYEYNGKAGVTPSYGSHCTCYNVYSRFNYAGFYYTGETEDAEGGQYGQMYCHGCVAEGNTKGGTKTGFRVDGAGNSMMLVGCKSIDNGTGYAIGNEACRAKMIDCKSLNDEKITIGSFEILRTTEV